MHGIGETAASFKEAFTNKDIELHPGTKIVLPMAPKRLVNLTLPPQVLHSWFDIKSLERPK
jgi:hypothetical protein